MGNRGISILGLLMAVMGGGILILMSLSVTTKSSKSLKRVFTRHDSMVDYSRVIHDLKEVIARAESIQPIGGDGFKVLYSKQSGISTNEVEKYQIVYRSLNNCMHLGKMVSCLDIQKGPVGGAQTKRVFYDLTRIQLCTPYLPCNLGTGINLDDFMPSMNFTPSNQITVKFSLNDQREYIMVIRMNNITSEDIFSRNDYRIIH